MYTANDEQLKAGAFDSGAQYSDHDSSNRKRETQITIAAFAHSVMTRVYSAWACFQFGINSSARCGPTPALKLASNSLCPISTVLQAAITSCFVGFISTGDFSIAHDAD
jgi:hypothetical protein